MKLPKIIKENLLLKMTSLNAGVIGIRLLVSFFIQRLLAELVGEAGISKIGQLRNVSQLLSSVTSVGIFSGIVKKRHPVPGTRHRVLLSGNFLQLNFANYQKGCIFAARNYKEKNNEKGYSPYRLQIRGI